MLGGQGGQARQGLELEELFSFGVGKALLWAEPAQGGMPGGQGREHFLPRHFLSPNSGRLGLQPQLPPTPAPTNVCPCLAGTPTLLPACLPLQSPLASQSPPCCHSVLTGMPGQVATVMTWGRAQGPAPQPLAPAALMSPSKGFCARVMPTPPALPMLGHPRHTGVCFVPSSAPTVRAKDKAQSQYLGRPPPSCHAPGVGMALPALLPGLPSKGP